MLSKIVSGTIFESLVWVCVRGCSVPDRVTPKIKKIVLDTSLLNRQHYNVRIKNKWSNPGKEVVPSPIPQSNSYWKGKLRVTLDNGLSTYLLLINKYIYDNYLLLIIFLQMESKHSNTDVIRVWTVRGSVKKITLILLHFMGVSWSADELFKRPSYIYIFFFFQRSYVTSESYSYIFIGILLYLLFTSGLSSSVICLLVFNCFRL